MGHLSKFLQKIKEWLLGNSGNKPDLKTIKLPSEHLEISPAEVKPDENIVHPPPEPPKEALVISDTVSSDDLQKRDPYLSLIHI